MLGGADGDGEGWPTERRWSEPVIRFPALTGRRVARRAGYPNLRLLCLVETGTQAMLGSVIVDGARPGERDETTLARRLLSLLGPRILVLLDRGFDKNPFFGPPTARGRVSHPLLAS